jgi:hypothetical protein
MTNGYPRERAKKAKSKALREERDGGVHEYVD